MNSVEILIIVPVLLFYMWALLPTIYQFQIKEYYFRRMFSQLRDVKRGESSFFIPVKRPAVTLRNLLIWLFGSIVTALYLLWVSYTYDLDQYRFGLSIAFGLIISKLAATLGLWLTAIPAEIKREYLIRKARKVRLGSDALVIGITGSYGKTSVKEFLAQILSEKFVVGRSIKSYNTQVGVAISILQNLKADTEIFISEMAAYWVGDIAWSSSISHPKIGIITGLGNQHIDMMGSREAIIRTKSELFRALPKDGTAYLNFDAPGADKALEGVECKVVTYSALGNQDADIYVLKVSKWWDNQVVSKVTLSNGLSFTTTLQGDHNIGNLIPCVHIAAELGFTQDEIEMAMENLTQPEAKLELMITPSGAIVVNDSSNSSVNGFVSAIRYVGELVELAGIEDPKSVIFTKGIVELGSEREDSYREILDEAGRIGAKLHSSDPLFIKLKPEKVSSFNDDNSMLEQFAQIDQEGSIILLEGRFSGELISKLQLKPYA